MSQVRALLAVLACAVLASACGASHSSSGAGGDPLSVQPTRTLVVIGADATVAEGLGIQERLQEAWPRLFYREAFPRNTVFVNAAVPRASASDALSEQVPIVDELSPTTVAIWLGAVEAMEHSAVGQFGRDLTEVVRHARAVGARVLVADLPRFGGVDVAPYNAAIARVARAQGATLVPLHDLQIGTLGGGPELRPDVEGHRKIADAFEAALRG